MLRSMPTPGPGDTATGTLPTRRDFELPGKLAQASQNSVFL
ncbi:hypothetical protein [Companilactobacillus furfuricola]|nr:hypothetical protein [Companilactobacillus furfuricola]